jgi:RNase P subunit RPR2
MEKRCKGCNRLLLIQSGGIKQIKCNNIEYNVNGYITVVCKCGTINKF